jgi:hypothetical protein
MEKPIELGRVRVENIGVGHRQSFQGLQECRSSLFPKEYAQVGLAALTQVSTGDCPQESRSRFGARD